MNILKLGILVAIVANISIAQTNAQCGKFADSPKEEDAMTAHVLYRDAVKIKDYDAAFDNWKLAYEIAPAADGKRPFHYTDGRAIYMHKFNAETDEAKKKEYSETIQRLYDEQIACYGETDGSEALLLGRKAFDMFYTLRTPYSKVKAVLEDAVAKGGNDTEYIVFVPYASIVEYLFTNEKMEKEEARQVYTTLNAIADHNIANSEKYKEQYEQSKASMNGTFAKIEDYIFDCAYFKEKLEPEYQAAPNDPAVIKRVYNKLAQKGCAKEDALMMELKGKYETYAAEENAKRKAEFEASNPAMMAKKAYDAGDYAGALAKYQEALNEVTDPVKQGEIYFSMASIEGRKLNNLSKGREYARKAAKLKTGWGRPYMLIGDLYAKGSRKCGDSFMQRCAILAALDKYAYAKSIDSSVAGDASSRISKYNSSKPDKETAFMMGHKEGSSVKVGCWIGETVKLRF